MALATIGMMGKTEDVVAKALSSRLTAEVEREVESMTDGELAHLARLVLDQQSARALSSADPAAILSQAFSDGFDRKGAPSDPYLAPGGVLVCLGYRSGSQTSHSCAFVSVDGEHKAWEHPSLIKDEMRYVDGDQAKMRSASLIPAIEGTTVTIVHARRSSAAPGCKMKRASSYEIVDGALKPVDAPPSPSLSSHR